jgi:hypothetical protein
MILYEAIPISLRRTSKGTRSVLLVIKPETSGEALDSEHHTTVMYVITVHLREFEILFIQYLSCKIKSFHLSSFPHLRASVEATMSGFIVHKAIGMHKPTTIQHLDGKLLQKRVT